MADPIKTRSNVLRDLAAAKALFQQRSIMAVLAGSPVVSNNDQIKDRDEKDGE